jgi:hypothetical protein
MRRMYTERTVNAQAMADSVVGKGKVKWTGKKETIAGHECEHADITVADGTTADLCLAKDLGAFLWLQRGPGSRSGGGMGGWQDQIGQTFPLKVVRDGKVVLLATHVEKKSLADSLFTVPAGYQKMGMSGRRGGGA